LPPSGSPSATPRQIASVHNALGKARGRCASAPHSAPPLYRGLLQRRSSSPRERDSPAAWAVIGPAFSPLAFVATLSKVFCSRRRVITEGLGNNTEGEAAPTAGRVWGLPAGAKAYLGRGRQESLRRQQEMWG